MSRVFVIGATGRIGRALRAVWGPRAATWQARRPVPGHVFWDPLNADCPLPLEGATVLCLAGGRHCASLQMNADIALAVLRAAEAGGAARVLLASSAAVYGPDPERDHAEDDALAPFSPYGRAKAQMEAVALAASGPPRTMLRIGNVVGADALIGGARPGVTVMLDPVPGGPMRSWIGPVTLARTLRALCGMAALPPVLNLAQPGPLRMAALLESAGIDWRYGLPNPATARRATLDTGRASALLGPVLTKACAPSLIAEWRGLAA